MGKEDEDYDFDFYEDQQRRSDGQLIAKARRYDVSIPTKSAKDGLWEEHADNDWFLTEKGRTYLRKEIQAETKIWRDNILAWVPLITAVTGLLAAIIGLIAFLSK